MSLLTQNDEDTDDGDAILLSSAAVHALVPEVRFVVTTIAVATKVITVCSSGDANRNVDVLVLVAKYRRGV